MFVPKRKIRLLWNLLKHIPTLLKIIIESGMPLLLCYEFRIDIDKQRKKQPLPHLLLLLRVILLIKSVALCSHPRLR
jgi:hypothetical protein